MKQIKLIANALLGIAFCLAGTSCQTDAISTPTVTSLNEALPVGSTRTTESLPFINRISTFHKRSRLVIHQ